jgi:hypothetical protein
MRAVDTTEAERQCAEDCTEDSKSNEAGSDEKRVRSSVCVRVCSLIIWVSVCWSEASECVYVGWEYRFL